MKENLIRIGCGLLGSLLTLGVLLIMEEIKTFGSESATDLVVASIEEPTTVEVTETVVSGEESAMLSDYEVEAEAKLQQLKEEEAKRKEEQAKEESLAIEEAQTAEPVEVKTVSANSIEAAPVKWIKDYPVLNSDKTLEEKMAERSSYEETLAVNAFDKKVIENSTIDFSDVKITIMGDSLTEGSNLDEEVQATANYPAVLQEILGCKEIVNLGIGGSSISSLGHDAMVERWRDIPKDSDIIIVFGGTNDMLFENKWDFGFIEYDKRMTEETFCGDLDILTSKIEYRYREHNDENYCKMIFINPPSNTVATGFYNVDPGNHVHQSQFAAAINQIAPEYSFEVIDFYNNNILNSHDPAVQAEFMPDGIHGNEAGYRIIAEHIASQIIQRIEQ